MAASPHEVELRQFAILTSGTVRGDYGESLDAVTEIEVEPGVAAAIPAPTGMRYRAVRPRVVGEKKRAPFGR
jgi:hypothetical protein